MSELSDDNKKLLARMVVRLREIRNRQPFLVRDGLDKFIIELEGLL